MFIDGALMDKVSVAGAHDCFSVFTKDKESSRQMASYRLSEFPPLEYMHLSYYIDDLEHIDNSAGIFIGSEFEHRQSRGKYYLTLQLGGRVLSKWREAYSFQAYACEFFKAFKVIDDSVDVDLIDSDETILNRENRSDGNKPYWVEKSIDEVDKSALFALILKFNYSSPRVVIADELARITKLIREVHDDVMRTLAPYIHSDAVTISFDFPEEVRIPCEQYLLYFVQFLKDLGVEATAELQHRAGEVLFSVTPTDKDEALDKIRAALDTYLHLSASPVNSLSTLNYEIAVQRLAGEIQGLQSRLSLARAEIQFKESTIQNQQVTINQQQRLLSGEVMTDSIKNVTPQAKAEDKEALIDGILSVGQYEEKGVQLNLAEIVRRLKRLFKGEEEGE